MINHPFVRSALVIILLSAPLLYLAYFMNSLPDTVPLHYGMDGQPDRFGPKMSLWRIHILITLISGILYFIVPSRNMQNLSSRSMPPEQMQGVAFGIVLFLCALQFVLLYTVHKQGEPLKLIGVLMGLFFAWIGNYMHSVKPNHVFGIRLPSTLKDEGNWRKTHYLGSKVFVVGGLCLVVGSLLLPSKASVVLHLLFIPFLALIPIIYSLNLEKKAQQH